MLVEPLHGNGANACPPLIERKKCPVDCKVGSWSSFSDDCHAAADASSGGASGGGYASFAKRRTRVVLAAARHGGRACPALGEIADCSPACSSGRSPLMGPWGEWSPCQTTGDNAGFRERSRTERSSNGGGVGSTGSGSGGAADMCLAKQRVECAVNCGMSGWSAWGSCGRVRAAAVSTADVSGGQQATSVIGRRRTRSVLVWDKHGGAGCEAMSETKGRSGVCGCVRISGGWGASRFV